jgi:hypothetical protein
MNVCLKVLASLPPSAARRALKQKTYYHGVEWAIEGVG